MHFINLRPGETFSCGDLQEAIIVSCNGTATAYANASVSYTPRGGSAATLYRINHQAAQASQVSVPKGSTVTCPSGYNMTIKLL